MNATGALWEPPGDLRPVRTVDPRKNGSLELSLAVSATGSIAEFVGCKFERQRLVQNLEMVLL